MGIHDIASSVAFEKIGPFWDNQYLYKRYIVVTLSVSEILGMNQIYKMG